MELQIKRCRILVKPNERFSKMCCRRTQGPPF
nr:MAG TPA: hypothetical protein [Caudoviricetes sp.]